MLSRAEKGTCGSALGLNYMIGIVAEGFPWFEFGKLTDDAVAFYYQRIAIGVTHDPFTAKDIYRLSRAIDDGDMIDKRVRTIRWSRTSRIVRNFFHSGIQSGQMFKGRFHVSL